MLNSMTNIASREAERSGFYLRQGLLGITNCTSYTFYGEWYSGVVLWEFIMHKGGCLRAWWMMYCFAWPVVWLLTSSTTSVDVMGSNLLVFFCFVCFVSFFFFFHPIFLSSPFLFSLPPSRNSDPGSHSRLFSPPTHYGSPRRDWNSRINTSSIWGLPLVHRGDRPFDVEGIILEWHLLSRVPILACVGTIRRESTR